MSAKIAITNLFVIKVQNDSESRDQDRKTEEQRNTSVFSFRLRLILAEMASVNSVFDRQQTPLKHEFYQRNRRMSTLSLSDTKKKLN